MNVSYFDRCSVTHWFVRNLVCEISNKNFVLFGDFNYRGIDWAVNCYDSNATVEARLFLDCVSDCLLHSMWIF